MPLSKAELDKRFVHHVPGPKRLPIHEEVRSRCLQFASEMNELLPDSREASLAFTSLEQFSFWAHAAVARNVEEEASDAQ